MSEKMVKKGRAGRNKPASRRASRARGLNFRFFMLVCSVLAGIGVFILVQHQLSVTCEVKSAKVAKQIAGEKTKQEFLRIKLAKLKSPARVTRIAQDEIGMVEPGGVIYLKYGKGADGQPSCQSAYEKRNEQPPINDMEKPSDSTTTDETSGAVTRR